MELLADARRAGESFAAAWPVALQRAVMGADDADGWRAALTGTAEAWAAGWERRPASSAQRALAAVSVDPERVPLDDDEMAAVCEWCDAALRRLSTGRTPIYCSPRCRRDASAARVAARAA